MRLFELELLKEEDDPQVIIDTIRQNCQPWLEQNPNNKHILYRGIVPDRIGYEYRNPNYLITVDVNQFRKPMDTPLWLQQLFNSIFRTLKFKANRRNSVFCSGNVDQTETYGKSFVVIPIGEFDFTWSPKVKDLYKFLHEPYTTDNPAIGIENDEVLKDKISDSWFMWNIMNVLDNILYDPNIKANPSLYKLATELDTEYIALRGSLNYDVPDMKRYEILLKFVKEIPNVELRDYILHRIKTGLAGKVSKSDTKVKIDKQKLFNFVKANYSDNNLPSAIDSGNEIMLHCKQYYAIDRSFYYTELDGKI